MTCFKVGISLVHGTHQSRLIIAPSSEVGFCMYCADQFLIDIDALTFSNSSRDQYSGATVHYVNEFYDEGDIIIQKKVRIDLTDDPKSLAEKVLMVEHEIYPSVVKAFCDDKKLIRDNIE